MFLSHCHSEWLQNKLSLTLFCVGGMSNALVTTESHSVVPQKGKHGHHYMTPSLLGVKHTNENICPMKSCVQIFIVTLSLQNERKLKCSGTGREIRGGNNQTLDNTAVNTNLHHSVHRLKDFIPSEARQTPRPDFRVPFVRNVQNWKTPGDRRQSCGD